MSCHSDEPLSPAELHPCKPLTWDSTLPHSPVTAVQLAAWRANPELLLSGKEVLVGDIENDGEPVAFQLRAFMMSVVTEKLRTDFYVIRDKDDTAYAFRDNHFWEIIGKATLVVRTSAQLS